MLAALDNMTARLGAVEKTQSSPLTTLAVNIRAGSAIAPLQRGTKEGLWRSFRKLLAGLLQLSV